MGTAHTEHSGVMSQRGTTLLAGRDVRVVADEHSASRASGNGQGSGTTYTHSHVKAGQGVVLESGGDTTLKGAVISAPQVSGKIGGDLHIESLQDTSAYSEKSKSSGFSVSVPITGVGKPGGSISSGKTSIHSNYQSVTEQSGIKTGDGGFQIEVGGTTTLKGGVISSTEAAVQQGKNSFQSPGGISTEDIQNTAAYSANGSGFTLGVGSSLGSSSAGVGSESGNGSSTSRAGISGIAGNTQARTGDTDAGLKPIFDKNKVKTEVQDQVTVTAAFGQQAGKAIGTYGDQQLQLAADKKNEAATEADPERRQVLLDEANTLENNWKEGGAYRVALHTVAAGVAGGGGGALGALVSQTTVPALGDAIDSMDLPVEAKQALTQGLAIGMGATVGGTAGAASAQNATTQNYLTPRENLTRNRAQAECRVNPGSPACATAARLNVLDQSRDRELNQAAQACNSGNTQACQGLNRTLNQLTTQGQAELQQLMQERQPGCAPPRDCANAANWTHTELATLNHFGQQIWAPNASGAVNATVGPEGVLAGGVVGAFRVSAAGFGLGAGFDAAGQLVTSGAIRPEQSLVAGVTGAVGLPLAARGNLWVPVAGAGAAVTNTTFNNLFYGEATNVWVAGGLGGLFGVAGPRVGARVESWLTPFITNTPRIGVTGPAHIPVQGRWPNAPGYVSNTVNNTVSNLPSFIPLDNGRPQGSQP